jgi:hypothetical protein
MQKSLFLLIALGLVICGFSQTNVLPKKDSAANEPTIDFALMDRVTSQHDFDKTVQLNENGQNAEDVNQQRMANMTDHRMLNSSFKLCARRLKMVTGKNKIYLINFFNQVLQSASHSVLSDGSIQEHYMRILHDTEEAITYVLKYPTIDLEQEYASGKSKLAPLTLY